MSAEPVSIHNLCKDIERVKLEWRVWGSFGQSFVYIIGTMPHIARCFNMARMRATDIGGYSDDAEYDESGTSSLLTDLNKSIMGWNFGHRRDVGTNAYHCRGCWQCGQMVNGAACVVHHPLRNRSLRMLGSAFVDPKIPKIAAHGVAGVWWKGCVGRQRPHWQKSAMKLRLDWLLCMVVLTMVPGVCSWHESSA